MLLEIGEFIRDGRTKQVCWIEKVSRETIEVGYSTYKDGEYGKDFVIVGRKEFYRRYKDL